MLVLVKVHDFVFKLSFFFFFFIPKGVRFEPDNFPDFNVQLWCLGLWLLNDYEWNGMTLKLHSLFHENNIFLNETNLLLSLFKNILQAFWAGTIMIGLLFASFILKHRSLSLWEFPHNEQYLGGPRVCLKFVPWTCACTACTAKLLP